MKAINYYDSSHSDSSFLYITVCSFIIVPNIPKVKIREFVILDLLKNT